MPKDDNISEADLYVLIINNTKEDVNYIGMNKSSYIIGLILLVLLMTCGLAMSNRIKSLDTLEPSIFGEASLRILWYDFLNKNVDLSKHLDIIDINSKNAITNCALKENFRPLKLSEMLNEYSLRGGTKVFDIGEIENSTDVYGSIDEDDLETLITKYGLIAPMSHREFEKYDQAVSNPILNPENIEAITPFHLEDGNILTRIVTINYIIAKRLFENLSMQNFDRQDIFLIKKYIGLSILPLRHAISLCQRKNFCNKERLILNSHEMELLAKIIIATYLIILKTI